MALGLYQVFLYAYAKNGNFVPETEQQLRQEFNFYFVLFFMLYYCVMEATGGTIGKRFLRMRTMDQFFFGPPDLLNSIKKTVIQFSPLALIGFLRAYLSATDEVVIWGVRFLMLAFVAVSATPIALFFNTKDLAPHDDWTQSNVLRKAAMDQQAKNLQVKKVEPLSKGIKASIQ
jgi:hypothetical protein